MCLVSSSGRASAFSVYNRVIGSSSPQRQGPLVSRLDMITVKSDFIVLSTLHSKEVKSGTTDGMMANVERSVLCIIRQSQVVCSPQS